MAAEEVSVFPQERLCRAKWTWKSRERGKQCREVFGAAAAPRLPLAACRHRASALAGAVRVFGSVNRETFETTTLSASRVSFSKHFQNADANQTSAQRQVTRPAQVKLTSLVTGGKIHSRRKNKQTNFKMVMICYFCLKLPSTENCDVGKISK